MYKIQCIARGKVVLGDLEISLTNGEIIDLDERFPRSVTDTSYNLNTAIHKEKVAVLYKDVEKSLDRASLMEIEQRLRASIIDEMKANQPVAPQPQPQPQAAPDSSLENKLNTLIQLVSKQQQNAAQTHAASTDSAIDDDKAVDIHTRAVLRLTKDAKGHVEASQNVKSDNDVSQIAKELEDLV